MMRNVLLFLLLSAAVGPAAAQTWDSSGNSMLKGTYYFREIYYFLDSSTGNVAESAVIFNTLSFDGNGNYTNGSSPAIVVDSSQGSGSEAVKGTYSIAASGYGFISDPLISGAYIYGLVSQQGIFIGSSTESGSSTEAGYNNLFIAAPLASPAATVATLKGTYNFVAFDVTSALEEYEYDEYGDEYITQSTFQVNPDGAGNLGTFTINGYFGGGGSTVYTQTASSIKYNFSNGAGSFTVPATGYGSAPAALMSGLKYMYVSPDGNFVFGGGTASWDFFVGVRTGTGTPNLNGLYYQAGIDEDESGVTSDGYGFLDTFYGSMYATSGVLWEHERLEYMNDYLADYATASTFSDTYTVPSSGAYSDPSGIMNYVVGAGGAVRIGFGIGPYLALNVALQAPSVSGSGVWINPQEVVNAGSSAPFTSGVSPGEFITIYGSNLAPSAQTASAIPFPTNLNGVSVTINSLQAPVYYVSPTQISALVPYETSSATIASISVNNNGTASNTVTAFVNPATPGLFAQTSDGVGLGSIQHAADYSLVTSASPAQAGETVVVYLAGLGAVSPSVADGTAAPSSTLSQPTNTVFADISGTEATASAFLTPGLAGLYQVNVTIPSGLTSGLNTMDVGTCPSTITAADCYNGLPQSYTSEVTIPVGSGGSGSTSALPAAMAQHRKPRAAVWSPVRRRTPSTCVAGGICPGKQ